MFVLMTCTCMADALCHFPIHADKAQPKPSDKGPSQREATGTSED
jgi:hypothetical protein